MLDALEGLRGEAAPFTVTVVDIDADDTDAALLTRFDELVPVLFGELDAPELCHYFIDKARVLAYLNGAGA
jgi:hypothetical protein